MTLQSFENLVPMMMIDAVEEAIGQRMGGLAAPLPSYINRVYEFETATGTRLIAKFYRPGRWSMEALAEEHQFVRQCAALEIPVVAPLALQNGSTLATTIDNIHFAVYPKRSGREIEINDEEAWRRIGSLIARVHNVGDDEDAPHRLMHHPLETTGEEIGKLLDGGYIVPMHRKAFRAIADRIMDLIVPLFDDIEFIRIHGDCHRANILERPGEGLMLIDFDDMMVGPPIQDLWLLLPEHALESRQEIDWLLSGYTMLRDFDRRTLRLIEPLRAMRMIYFLAWIAQQSVDFNFMQRFEGWGTDAFWRREITDLEQQYEVIGESLQADLPL